jgi:HK97 family phage portal protein
MFDGLIERRAVSAKTLLESGATFAGGTRSRVVVDEETVFQVNAVFSAVSMIASTISTLPVDVYFRRDGARIPFRPKPQWVDRPDVDLPREAFYNAMIVSLLLDGNAFARVFSNQRGEVVNLVVLNPLDVEVKRKALGRLQFKIVSTGEMVSAESMVFIPDVLRPGHVRGVSRVEALKENFGLALALERFASQFFGQGSVLSGIIEYPGSLTEEQSNNLRSSFDSKHGGWRRAHRTGILSGGAKWVQTQADPEKSTMVESRNQAVADVARAFNMPPHLLALPGTTSYASVEQSNLAWVTHCLRPIVEKLEGALSPFMSRTLGGQNAFIKFSLDGLLRADIQARNNSYSIGIQAGYLSINDVRSWEDLRPVDDPAASSVRVPLSNINVDAADLIAMEKRVAMLERLIRNGYEPAAASAAVGLPAITHTGLPSVQLQQVALIDPENPGEVYEVE